MSGVDAEFAEVCRGSHEAFARWMGCVERPIRLSLFPFVQAVDIESVVQETLLRMWLYAQDRGGKLQGVDASLRFAIGMARNIARSEARRLGRMMYLPPENMPEPLVSTDPPPDPGLRQAIADCLERVARRPHEALMARLHSDGAAPDDVIAATIKMKLNTFYKNIQRAREQLVKCLTSKGVPIEELMP